MLGRNMKEKKNIKIKEQENIVNVDDKEEI